MGQALDLPDDQDLGIERAHQALTQKPVSARGKPRSIVKFGSYRTKEEVFRKAWPKRSILQRIAVFVDHDFPTEVFKKNIMNMQKPKKVLKSERIRFQTPIYQNAAEATEIWQPVGFQSPW